MKKITELLIICLMAVCFHAEASVQRSDLGGKWQFRQSSSVEWHEATVPGGVHTDLMAAKLINDPFYGVNEKTQQWIGEKDWVYQRTFSVDRSVMDKQNIELVMTGIDTYANVCVNNVPLIRCDNMFRTWRVDIKPYLKEGENVITISFQSIFRVDVPKYLDAPFKLQAWPNNDQADIWLSLYARKAGYNYGWDWGPRLITTGIWRDIYIESWNVMKIDAAQIKTLALPSKSSKLAKMSAVVDIDADSGCDAMVSVKCSGETLVSKSVKLNSGENQITLGFDLRNPKLWWSNGLGDQHLYDFDVEVRCGSTTATNRIRTGVRTVEVIREKDAQGQSMYVRLNGEKVFMKGANYIPLDNFPARVEESWYEYIIKSAAEVNMNMLRIWGGGIYEKDVFYDMCDKYGILVWQDMMFACGMFPADRIYLDNVANEVKDNVKRLRNHPSIALWNGNNENEISYFEWGWRDQYTPEQDRIYQANLKTLFYEVIPQAIASVDDTRYYHPTSPVTGYNNIPYNMGDVHFWSVWKGGWVEEYTEQKNIGRFMSEYGFQSYPEMSTIRKFAKQGDQYLESEVILAHQRARNDQTRDPHFGNKMMTMYMAKYFNVPSDFEQYVYMSQLLQAEAVKVGIEAHRRAMPYCMGTLYWQINDCWSAASWSSIDYYGRWKGLHYFAKNAFSEILVSPYKDGDMVKFKIVSDRRSAAAAELKITAMTLEGKTLFSKTQQLSIAANSSQDMYQVALTELIAGAKSNEAFVVADVVEGGKIISSNIYYPEYSNKYSYPDVKPTIKTAISDNGVMLSISSPVLIRGLYLWLDDQESHFSDNYVTVVPGRDLKINIETTLTPAQIESSLRQLSVNALN